MSALSDLLNRHIAASDKFHTMSNRRIADAAGVSHGTVNNYRNGKVNTPKEDVLQAFHELLGIPLAELREAAGVPRGESEPYVAPAEFNRLSHAQRTALDEFVRSFVGPQGVGHAVPVDPSAQPDAPPQVDKDEEVHQSLDNGESATAVDLAAAARIAELEVDSGDDDKKQPG